MFPIPRDLAQSLSARPLTPKGHDRLDRILRAAMQVLVEEGEAGFTMRSVAKAAQITLGNLQYYFESKEDLLCGMIDCIVLHYKENTTAISSSGAGNGNSRFEAVIRYMLEDVKDPTTSSLFFSIWSIAKRNQFVSQAVNVLYAHGRALISGLIAELNPSLPAAARELRAALILTQIEGLMVLAVHGMAGHPELDGLFDEAIRHMRRLALEPSVIA